MGRKKVYDGYKAFDYLEAGFDYKEFELCKGSKRVAPYYVPLSKGEEELFEEVIGESTVISLHEHPVLWPEDMGESMEMKNLGRDFAAYEDLSSSRLDCVFDHLMDGMAYVTSYA
jgi:membrane dipeptidase